MKMFPILLVFFLLGVLTACASAGVAKAPESLAVTETVKPTVVLQPTAQATSANLDLKRSDAQGAVTVEITPLNLEKPGDTLDFDVAMDTHSVDLSMDLAELSSLMADQKEPIPAIKWDAKPGGHHVSGKLSFPAVVDGKPVLEGAKRLTITIEGVDAPIRLFTWQLSQ